MSSAATRRHRAELYLRPRRGASSRGWRRTAAALRRASPADRRRRPRPESHCSARTSVSMKILEHRGAWSSRTGPCAERIMRVGRAGEERRAQLRDTGCNRDWRDPARPPARSRRAPASSRSLGAETSRMRSASICSATSRSSAGTVKKYCVTRLRVSALKLPPMTLPMSASWSAERPGLPRNIMCSRACAVPGKAARRLVGADEIVDVRRHNGRERVAHDDHAQAVRQRRAQHLRALMPDAGVGRPRCRQRQQRDCRERRSGVCLRAAARHVVDALISVRRRSE